MFRGRWVRNMGQKSNIYHLYDSEYIFGVYTKCGHNVPLNACSFSNELRPETVRCKRCVPGVPVRKRHVPDPEIEEVRRLLRHAKALIFGAGPASGRF